MLIKLLGAAFGGGGTTAAGAEWSRLRPRPRLRCARRRRLRPDPRQPRLPAAGGAAAAGDADDAVGDDFVQDLALTGREGTVADRMDGTAAEGRCRTKTGTLTGVSDLSGYCFNPSGRVMIFSILMGERGHLASPTTSRT